MIDARRGMGEDGGTMREIAVKLEQQPYPAARGKSYKICPQAIPGFFHRARQGFSFR